MTRPVFIYSLSDPSTGNIGYVGASTNVKQRLRSHISIRSKGGNSKKDLWIKEMIADNREPCLSILEECTEENWKAREDWWISEGKRLGWTLKNTSRGGTGKIEMSDKAKEKISHALSGTKSPMYGKTMSEKARRKISLSHAGIKQTRETIEKRSKSMSGRSVSEKTKDKIRKANQGKVVLPETRDKLRKANTGKRHSEEAKRKIGEATRATGSTIIGCDECKRKPWARGLCHKCYDTAERLGVRDQYKGKKTR